MNIKSVDNQNYGRTALCSVIKQVSVTYEVIFAYTNGQLKYNEAKK